MRLKTKHLSNTAEIYIITKLYRVEIC